MAPDAARFEATRFEADRAKPDAARAADFSRAAEISGADGRSGPEASPRRPGPEDARQSESGRGAADRRGARDRSSRDGTSPASPERDHDQRASSRSDRRPQGRAFGAADSDGRVEDGDLPCATRPAEGSGRPATPNAPLAEIADPAITSSRVAESRSLHEPRRGDGSEPLRRRRSAGDPPLYAALDLGTNNCRLLVAEPWQQSFRVVDAFSRIVRLGEGLSRTGRLSDAAQDRAIDALRVCRGKLEARGIVRARLVATEACRAAENGLDFLARVEDETGLSLEVLTRETEARLAVAGCANLVDWRSDGVLLFDIGGGSSELVWLDLSQGRRHGGDPTRHIRAWTSLPVGVVTLSERHGGHSVGPEVFEDMVADVTELLAHHAAWDELDERLKPERWHMLGTSGTVTTLAGVHLGLKRYDRRRVDGTWLADKDVGAMIGRLLAMDFEDRVANPCIGGDRADLVLAGCAILEAIRRRWRCDRLRVADRGLREGMLTELMIGDGVWRRPDRWPRRPAGG
jgi:exopolyphosphatase/guanosine-5'-triphosphate,3'-diphosphate pyrophosphatase